MRFLFLCFCLPFAVISFEYDEDKARVLYNLASAAYGEALSECVEKTFPNAADFRIIYNVTVPCDGGKCSFFALRADKENITTLAFRGTRGLSQLSREVISIIFKSEEDYEGLGQVSSYFVHAVNELFPFVSEVLEMDEIKNDEMFVTGHSLGGAIAALAAARIAKEGLNPTNRFTVYTFGQPRLGSRKFAENYNRLVPNTARVVNRHDFTARAKWFGYFHHGTKIWYPKGMAPDAPYKVCDEQLIDDSPDCEPPLLLAPWKWRRWGRDHSTYFERAASHNGKRGCMGMKLDHQGEYAEKV